jgi:hypothetical protein
MSGSSSLSNSADNAGSTSEIKLTNMVSDDLKQLETDIIEAALIGAQALQQIENTQLQKTPDLAKKRALANADNYSTVVTASEQNYSDQTLKEFNDATKQNILVKQTNAQNQNIKKLQDQVLNKNNKNIANLNTDILTAKRVATINKQELIHTQVTCDYLRICIIFVAIAVVILFFSSIQLLPHMIMEMLLILLGTVLLIIILYKLIMNSNHYNMLYQERVFPMYMDAEEDDKDCNCDEPDDDDDEPELIQTQQPSCRADDATPSQPSP